MVIKPFKSAIPKLSSLFSYELFFQSVKENYPEYRDNGFYECDEDKALFIYRYEGKERSYTGLLACTDTNDYKGGAVVRHEGTLVNKETRQRKLLKERNAMIKPILLTYPKTQNIQTLQYNYTRHFSPFYSIDAKDAKHTVWKIKEKVWIKQFVDAFEKDVPKAYIADGHHRAATVANMFKKTGEEAFNKIFSIYLSYDDVEVSNWNRVITGLNGLSNLSLMADLSRFFNIRRLRIPYQPRFVHTIVMYLNEEWFELKWKLEIVQQYERLPLEQRFDISIFNNEIAQGILGIGNIREDKRIINIESKKGFEGLTKAVNNAEKESVGFIFSPIDLKDMISVTNSGATMPPKSTYMLPRMMNGFVVYPF
jgi:uncharacterized protein (DUF1015 family)